MSWELKPDLSHAAGQIDLTKPVQTRNGKPVRILCTDANGIQPVVALILLGGGVETTIRYGLDGSYSGNDYPSDLDLINVQKKKYKLKSLHELFVLFGDKFEFNTWEIHDPVVYNSYTEDMENLRQDLPEELEFDSNNQVRFRNYTYYKHWFDEILPSKTGGHL